MAQVSAVIKAKDEGHQIAAAIQSARLIADEIIVVDDGSTDDTVVVSEAEGAIVIHALSVGGRIDELDRIGFLAATGQWILRMDADERMTNELAQRLGEAVAQQAVCGVRFARRNFLFGEWLRYGGWFRADQTRFFRSDAWDRSWSADPHSQVPIQGEVLQLPAMEELSTLHYDYVSVSQFIHRTLGGYALTEARQEVERGTPFRWWKLVWKPLRMFLGCFVVRRGYRDGVRGLVAASLLAANELCRHAMIWDLSRSEDLNAPQS